jgi:hypothetical protein
MECARSIQKIGPADSIIARRRHAETFFNSIDPKRTLPNVSIKVSLML